MAPRITLEILSPESPNLIKLSASQHLYEIDQMFACRVYSIVDENRRALRYDREGIGLTIEIVKTVFKGSVTRK